MEAAATTVRRVRVIDTADPATGAGLNWNLGLNQIIQGYGHAWAAK